MYNDINFFVDFKEQHNRYWLFQNPLRSPTLFLTNDPTLRPTNPKPNTLGAVMAGLAAVAVAWFALFYYYNSTNHFNKNNTTPINPIDRLKDYDSAMETSSYYTNTHDPDQ